MKFLLWTLCQRSKNFHLRCLPKLKAMKQKKSLDLLLLFRRWSIKKIRSWSPGMMRISLKLTPDLISLVCINIVDVISRHTFRKAALHYEQLTGLKVMKTQLLFEKYQVSVFISFVCNFFHTYVLLNINDHYMKLSYYKFF